MQPTYHKNLRANTWSGGGAPSGVGWHYDMINYTQEHYELMHNEMISLARHQHGP